MSDILENKDFLGNEKDLQDQNKLFEKIKSDISVLKKNIELGTGDNEVQERELDRLQKELEQKIRGETEQELQVLKYLKTLEILKKTIQNRKIVLNDMNNDKGILSGRPKDVVYEIQQSSLKLENQIKNYDQEKNPVARSLLKIVNWIMGTEK